MSGKDPKGYYRILGVSFSADTSEIKTAFRRRAMEIHPDRNNAANSKEEFQFLNEAYTVLSDAERRAQYDTSSFETGSNTSTSSVDEVPDPISCSCCGKVSAQPRYVIFYEVKSYIFLTTKSAIQGVFCSACAEKKAFKASAITWILGWWGFPWGPIYSVQSLFNNMIGGQQPVNINAKLAAQQAWVFAVLGKVDMARAVALDAMDLAKKIKPDKESIKKKTQGYDIEDEGLTIKYHIEKLFDILGSKDENKRLKDSWKLLRRPFYVQSIIACCVIGFFAYLINQPEPYITPPEGPKPYLSSPPQEEVQPQFVEHKESYTRPIQAPNGEDWPLSAGYVKGFPLINENGLSTVTVDNTQNDSDVFVKLISLDSDNAFPIRSFFIPARESFTLKNVTVGMYDIRYRDLNTGSLSRSEKFDLVEIKDLDGTQYSNITMTLYKVRNGNMKTYNLGEDEF